MRTTKLGVLLMLLAIVCACYLSAPVFSAETDEHPWDADGNGGGDGNDSDTTIVGDDDEVIRIVLPDDPPPGGNPLMDMLFQTSYSFAKWLMGHSSSISSAVGAETVHSSGSGYSEAGNQAR
ncbi:MAG: hypothetical protein ACE5FH_04065 [Candidatus Zixiibacteriota bacterium]